MKELVTRSIFGIIFLLFVFTPYFLDLSNQTHLFNLVLYTFSMFSTYELFQIGKNTPYKSGYLLPALILNTAIFLPMLIETARSLYPNIPSSGFWMIICNYDLLAVLWIVVLIAIVAFIVLVYQKKSIVWIYKYTFLLSIFYSILPLAVLSIAMTQSPVQIKQLLFVVLLPIYLNDTLAYLTGRLMGKHKMFPSVSPKKTWEGFFGGMIGAAISMLLLMYFRNGGTPEMYGMMAGISVSVSILATYGDLFESKLKRAAAVKDSGKILPGHGGVLDRIDAMLFTAPVLYVFLAT